MTFRGWLIRQRDYYRDRPKEKRARHNDKILMAAFGRALEEFDRRFDSAPMKDYNGSYTMWWERAEEVQAES